MSVKRKIVGSTVGTPIKPSKITEGFATEAQLKATDDKVETLREVVSSFHSNIQEIGSGEVITVSDASDLPLAGLKVFGKTTQNGTPTPAEPVPLESVGDVTVTICGKNLFATAMPVSVGADGVETANNSTRSTSYIPVKPGMKMAFSKSAALTASNANGMLRCFDENKEIVQSISVLSYNALSGVRTIPEGVAYVRFCQFGFTGVEGLKIQIEFGDAVTDYADTEAKTLPISTDYGLPGIPVESGGNYTDSNGKHWICDEVDFEKGVYVQRVKILTLNGSEAWAGYSNSLFGVKITDAVAAQFVLCNRYSKPRSANNYGEILTCAIDQYRNFWITNAEYNDDVNALKSDLADNPLTVVYILEKYIEHPLSAEQLAAFAELHSNYPNTMVFNDRGAEVEVKYVADTKLYIDKKFNELAAALVNRT